MKNQTTGKRTLRPISPGLPLVGGQLSTAGGWSQVYPRALAVGAEVIQTFSSNPRMWPSAPPDAAGLAELSHTLQTHDLPLFMHSIYLINPASPDEGLRQRSAAALAHALFSAALGGAAGVVTHLGSHRGQGFDLAVPWIADTLRAARSQAQDDIATMEGVVALHAAPHAAPPDLPPLLLETGAGSGATVGGTLDEFETLFASLEPAPNDSRCRYGLCLDTAHMFAAGYAIHEADGLDAVVAELEHRQLLRRLRLVHLNDSASAFSSRRDRHANPGEGELSYDGLARLVSHPAFAHIPFVLEVPGSEGHGPGRTELDVVKTMRPKPSAQRLPPARHERGRAGPE